MMDTVLFTDHGIVVFAITTGAIALMLMLAVLGLATTHRTTAAKLFLMLSFATASAE
jgi:hypothetical protein